MGKITRLGFAEFKCDYSFYNYDEISLGFILFVAGLDLRISTSLIAVDPFELVVYEALVAIFSA